MARSSGGLTRWFKENWVDVIPHREDVLVEDIEIFKNYLVVNERKNGLNHLRIISWDKKEDYYQFYRGRPVWEIFDYYIMYDFAYAEIVLGKPLSRP